MRILQLTQSFSRNGGVGNYVLRLSQALIEQKHSLMILHDDARAENLAGALSQRIENFTEYEPKPSPETNQKVIELIEEWNPDVIHIQTNNNFSLETALRSIKPTVKSLHVYDFCPTGNKYFLGTSKICDHATGIRCLWDMATKRCTLSKNPQTFSLFYRRSLGVLRNDRFPQKVLVASEYARRLALQSGYDEQKVSVLPYFVPIPEHSPTPHESIPIILFTGRVVPEKGLDRLIRALSFLPKSLSWKCVVDGEGSALEECRKLSHQLDLDSKIEFAGWLHQKKHEEIFRKAFLVATPSLWPEPFGLVGPEAMAFEKPVIGFNVGGIPEWLENEKTGFLVEPENVPEFSKKIEFLLTHPEIANQMGKRGREKALTKFHVQKHLASLLPIYKAAHQTYHAN